MNLNLRELSLRNTEFKNIIENCSNMTLAVMNIDTEIGEEVHDKASQFIFIINGQAKVIIDSEEKILNQNEYTLIPAGKKHNIIKNGDIPVKLFTIYGGELVSPEDAVITDVPPMETEPTELIADTQTRTEGQNMFSVNGVGINIADMAGGNYNHEKLKDDYMKLKRL
jgi:mannose-6-phosphate isomerase-like protein (cupin superfamily)